MRCRTTSYAIEPSTSRALATSILCFPRLRRLSRPVSPMRRAMGFWHVQHHPRGRLKGVRPVAMEGTPAPLYPQLDVKRFLGASGHAAGTVGTAGTAGKETDGLTLNKSEQARSLRDALGSSRQRPAAVFGVGLGVRAEEAFGLDGRGLGKPAFGRDLADQEQDETLLEEEVEEEEREEQEEEQEEQEEEEIMEEEEEEKEEVEEDKAATAPVITKPRLDSPHETPLAFKMSTSAFHAALAAPPGSPESYWCHSMYSSSNPNSESPESADPSDQPSRVKVHYCTSRDSMDRVCRQHFLSEPVLGLDLEWMIFATRASGPRENVSVIQLASPSRIAIFHIAMFSGADEDDLVAPTFRKILADADVRKVGVNILADCTRLRTTFGVQGAGIFELSHLYRMVKYLPQKRFDLVNRKLVALAAQVEDQLGLPLFKGESVRTSNWMKRLDESQLRYSASDAYASIQLYHVLESKRQALDPCPPPPLPAELRLPLPLSALGKQNDILTAKLDALAISPKSIKSIKSKRRAPLPPTQKQPPAVDPRVLAADLKISAYRSSKSAAKTTAKNSSLRAYYLWADPQALSPETVASLLRSPPLQTSTVVTYIMDAILAEKLPYDKERAKRELAPHVHPNAFRSARRLSFFARGDGSSGL